MKRHGGQRNPRFYDFAIQFEFVSNFDIRISSFRMTRTASRSPASAAILRPFRAAILFFRGFPVVAPPANLHCPTGT